MNSKTSRSDSVPHEEGVVDYSRLFRDTPEPCLLFGASEPYIIVDINQARAKFSGISSTECIGRPLFEIYPYTNKKFRDTAAKDLRENLTEVARSGRSYQIKPDP